MRKSSLPWPIQMRQKTSSMKTLNLLSLQFLLLASSSFLVTLMQELDKTVPPGKEYWVNTGLENAIAMAYWFFRPASSITITNTVFCHPTNNKTSWMNPCSKHWHLIDCHCETERQAGCESHKGCVWCKMLTNHCLIISKLSIWVQPKTRELELMTSKITETRMTWKTSIAVWRTSMALPVPAYLCFWVQMESSSYQKNKILERWVEHFDGVLNRPSSINNKIIEWREQVTPSLQEV